MVMKVAFLFDSAVSESEAIASIKAHFSGKVHVHGHDLTPAQVSQLNAGQPVHVGSTAVATAPLAAGAPVNLAPPVAGMGPATLTTAGPVGGAQLDKDGVPWDERIHSSNKEMTDKGVWRKRRGVSPADFERITAELKATMGAGLPAAIPATALAAPAVTAPPLPAAAAPVMPALPLPPAGPTPEQLAYDELCRVIAENLRTPNNPAGRITDEWVNQVIVHYGVVDSVTNTGSLQLLQHRADIVTQVREYLRQTLGA